MTSIGIRPATTVSPPLAQITLPPAFESPQGEAAYMAAYDAIMRLWPVVYDPIDVSGRFGRTHLVVSGAADAPPLLLLHGYTAGLTMWIPNVADLAAEYRVYALDVMGQPGRSVPAQPIGSRSDAVEWLTSVLDALGLERVSLAGMSYGGWLTLAFALAAPERVHRIVLLSPAGGFVPLDAESFGRSVAAMESGTRDASESFLRWAAGPDAPSDDVTRERLDRLVDQFHLGVTHFRKSYLNGAPPPLPFTDDELRSLRVPTLLMVGDGEPLYDAAAAVERARRLVPNVEVELVPRSGHMMSFYRAAEVDRRVLAFLRQGRDGGARGAELSRGARPAAAVR